MININEVIETNKMIDKENLDVRTITLGISLLDCIDSDLQNFVTTYIKRLRRWQKIWLLQEKKLEKNLEFRL